MIKTIQAALISTIVLTGASLGQEAEDTSGPPAWYAEHVAFMSRDGGRWITDNADYVNDDEPMVAYGIEWREAIGGAGLSGRLFGVQANGEETGDYWEFREFWHAGDNHAVLQQWGFAGQYGVGVVTSLGDGASMVDQTFYGPDGSVSRSGHMARSPTSDEHVTESFTIENGAWSLDRSYVWRRELTPSQE